jgi:serralysin
MRPVMMEDFRPSERETETSSPLQSNLSGFTPTSVGLTTADGQTPARIVNSFTTETLDVFRLALQAGVTYSFAQRPTATGGIEDPYLLLADLTGKVLAGDDDGGFGRSSLLTFTPATTGDYLVAPSSWFHLDPTAPGYPDYRDAGGYTLDIWRSSAATDAPATLAGALTLNLGTTYGHLDVAGDRDMYKIELTAGQFYTFTYAGGIAGGGEYPDYLPGESIGILRLYDANGVQISAAVNYETGLGFLPEANGTYYLRIEGYEAAMTGGYTLDVRAVNPLDYDPLESLNWDDAANIPVTIVNGRPVAYVYFASAAEGGFGETEADGETPITTYGWENFQIEGVMRALQEYTPITGITYLRTTNIDQATFRLVTTVNEEYGAKFYPQEEAYGDLQGLGIFNLISGGFTEPDSLQPGGFSYAVILHEFGHAHGVAHPHDEGGGSEIMLGVSDSTSLGIYDLNQGVYTVMSYNDGFQTHPDGTLAFSRKTWGSGWSGTLGAFDIAVLQARYGVHAHNTGNTVYEIEPLQQKAFYQTIWDTGGTDSIVYNGGRDAHIDLLAATLDYTPTGGGVVSFVEGTFGGFTIANGVVIENAKGGNGDDAIMGNSAANTLNGDNGHDSLIGREGNDSLVGGTGKDDLQGGAGDDTLSGGTGSDTLDGGAGNDRLIGGAGEDVFVFTDAGVDTIVDYQRGEKIDVSELDVTWANVTLSKTTITIDLVGADDLAIHVGSTAGIRESDFLFG